MTNTQTTGVNSITLRSYQAEADAAAWEAYTSGAGRALIVMATGLGKTFTAAWFTRRWLRENPGKRAAFLVDTVDATKQGRKEFAKMLGNEFSTGIRCGRVRQNLDANVLFSTFDSMAGLLKRKKIHSGEFGLVIVDESHHARAETYEAVITAFEDAFFYAMTATPNRADGRDIRDLFGEEVYSYLLREALVEGKWLAPVTYKLMNGNFDTKQLEKLQEVVGSNGRKVSRTEINRRLFLESQLEEVVGHVHEHQRSETQTIVFCSSIDHAQEASSLLEGAEPYYSGLDFSNGRKNPLVEFRAGRLRTIVVVDKLNEAVDVPEADLLIFWRSTAVYRIWAQQLGRGLRKAEGKSGVTVLDFVANCERVLMLQREFERIQAVGNPNRSDSESDADENQLDVIGIDNFQIEFTQEVIDLIELLQAVDMEKFTFEEAKAEIRRLGCPFQTGYDYRNKALQVDRRFHSIPESYYEDEWKDYGEYLGTGRKDIVKFTFEEAKAEIRRLGCPFRSPKDYRSRALSTNSCFHCNPEKHYADDGWIDAFDYLGLEPKFTFEEAKAEIRRLGCPFKDLSDYEKCYQEFSLRFYRFPKKQYSSEWKDLYDYLGLEPKFTFEEAKAEIRRLGCPFKSLSDYRKRCGEVNSRFYRRAKLRYKTEGWIDSNDYLGLEPKFTFEEAKAEIRRLGCPFRNGVDYGKRCGEVNSRFYRHPAAQYRDDGWVGINDYLGLTKDEN